MDRYKNVDTPPKEGKTFLGAHDRFEFLLMIILIGVGLAVASEFGFLAALLATAVVLMPLGFLIGRWRSKIKER
jgi:hypothetical protein